MMMYRSHVINKINDVYKKTFPVRLKKKRVNHFVAGELLLVFKCVIDV